MCQLPKLGLEALYKDFSGFDDYFSSIGAAGYWTHNQDQRKVRYYAFSMNKNQWADVAIAFWNDHAPTNPIIAGDYNEFWRDVRSGAVVEAQFLERFTFHCI